MKLLQFVKCTENKAEETAEDLTEEVTNENPITEIEEQTEN
jgi:hypothetical protein